MQSEYDLFYGSNLPAQRLGNQLLITYSFFPQLKIEVEGRRGGGGGVGGGGR